MDTIMIHFSLTKEDFLMFQLYAASKMEREMETTTYDINLPCTEAYSIACGGITTAKPFDIHRHRIDEYDTNTYGKCIGNDTIIIKQRPKNSNGFYFRSILKFKEIDENKCLLSVSNRSKTFFAKEPAI